MANSHQMVRREHQMQGSGQLVPLSASSPLMLRFTIFSTFSALLFAAAPCVFSEPTRFSTGKGPQLRRGGDLLKIIFNSIQLPVTEPFDSLPHGLMCKAWAIRLPKSLY
jgi:hypothetical protein